MVRTEQVEKKLSGEIAAVRNQIDDVRPELGRTHALVERLQGTIDVRLCRVCIRSFVLVCVACAHGVSV